MNLHPYDGLERCFRHDDADPGAGRDVVRRILHLPATSKLEGVKYEMSFYSGGTGIFDHVAITVPFDARVVESAALLPLEKADDEDLRWLLDVESGPLREAAVAFINEERDAFQPECAGDARIWFEWQSGVNHWVVMWETTGALSYRAFDQG